MFHRVILHFVKVRWFKGNRTQIFSIDDIRIVMQDRDIIATIVFFMSQCRFTGTGQAEYTDSIGFAIIKVITFHTAMASNIAEAICQGPCQCKGPFFMLTEIAHTKNHRTVMSRVKDSKTTWMARYNIIWIRVDVDITFWDL